MAHGRQPTSPSHPRHGRAASASGSASGSALGSVSGSASLSGLVLVSGHNIVPEFSSGADSTYFPGSDDLQTGSASLRLVTDPQGQGECDPVISTVCLI